MNGQTCRKAACAVGVALLFLLGAANQALGSTFLQKFGGESSGAGRLSAPRDVAIDSAGNAWVADTAHNRVQKFNSSGEFVSQFGVPPVTSLFSSGLTGPAGIAIDAEGNIWVAAATKVRKFKPSGELLLSFGTEGAGNGQFIAARDLAIDPSGNLWVVDAGTGGSGTRVQKFNAKGEYLSQFGKEGAENGQFKSPESIAVDSEGNILVADTGNNRYQEFTAAGGFVRIVGSKGTGSGQFESPRGIVVDSEGKVWVADSGNHRLQRFSAKGAYLSQLGAYGPNDGQFVEPRGLAVSGSSIWVADTGNDRVQKLSYP
jgi:DNA-binding beta-propeller fold protein YncE